MPPEAPGQAELQIRQAEADDLGALVALSRRTFAETFGHIYKPEDLAAYLEEAHAPEFYAGAIASPDYLVLVAFTEDGTPSAYLLCSPLDLPAKDPHPGAVELMRLYVDRPLQGRGLGSFFLAEALRWARSKDAPEIYLSVFSENEGARRLYEREGFEKVGEFLFPVGDHRDLEFLMRRPME